MAEDTDPNAAVGLCEAGQHPVGPALDGSLPDTSSRMRWSFGSMLFYRVLVLWLWSRYGNLTLTGVWIVFSLDLATQAVIFTRLHFRGKWLDARV